jgi:hypothetical protein
MPTDLADLSLRPPHDKPNRRCRSNVGTGFERALEPALPGQSQPAPSEGSER